jgi:4-carboxymuconolactone decarboxylase
MSRLARLRGTELTGAQRELFDLFAGTERIDPRAPFPRVGRDGALEGPFNAMLYSPALGMALQAVGAQVRFRSTLADRCREMAILTVAAAWDSAYERGAHEAIARKVGVTDEQIAAIAAREPVPTDDATETLVVHTARALAVDGDLDDEQYAAAVAALGEQTLFELTVLVGYYAQLAMQLRVFRVKPPQA